MNKTRKTTISMKNLQSKVKKYRVTRSGSKTNIAKRLLSLRSVYMPQNERNILGDFIKLPSSKRDTRAQKKMPLR